MMESPYVFTYAISQSEDETKKKNVLILKGKELRTIQNRKSLPHEPSMGWLYKINRQKTGRV